MLPTGYAAGPDRRWPVTYYMHGTNGDQATFRTWGCHTRLMFRQQIAETLPRFASRFAAGSSAPTIFDYRSIEPQFSVFGWSVTADPDRALEFLDLKDASASGFTITGSGLTRITTPPLFRGARAVTVLINGVPSSVKPDATGRLLAVVDLGPAARDQQYTVGGTGNRRSSVVRLVRR